MNRLFKTTALGAATLALFGCNQSQTTFTEPESLAQFKLLKSRVKTRH